MNKKKEGIGIVLIGIGLILLLAKIRLINISWVSIWPVFILIPGISFEIFYFYNRDFPAVLVPGGILTVSGATLFICAFFGKWSWMSILWPLFPLSVAIGLFQLYLFGDKNKGLLIPVIILGGIAVIALFTSLVTVIIGTMIPVILILLGGYILWNKRQTSDM